jgi:hypothetical protein
VGGAETLDRGDLGRILMLPLLAKDIAESIVDGRQMREITLSRLLEPRSVES